MNISQKGIDLIKRFEGLRLVAYKVVSSEKYYTIGYGHYGKGVRKGQKITEEYAEELLRSDVRKFVDGVNKYLKADVTQNQFDALVSFSYNVGVTAFKNSTLLEKLNKGDHKGASNEFPRWNKSGGEVLGGLVTRRKIEKELFDKEIVVSSNLTIDGKWGKKTTLTLQKLFGTPQDGVISDQIIDKYNDAILTLLSGVGGSVLVRSIQKWLKVKVDGYLGKVTITALQKKLGVKADGYVGVQTTMELQRKLNKGTLK